MKENLPKPGFLVVEGQKELNGDLNDLNISEQTGFNYVCGYFVKKLLTKHDCTVCKLALTNKDNISLTNNLFIENKQYKDLKFGLIVPSNEFVFYIQKLENIMQDNFTKFMYDKNVGLNIYKLMDKVEPCINICEHFPKEHFLKLFIRIRIYYILMFLNLQIKNKVRNLKIINLQNL